MQRKIVMKETLCLVITAIVTLCGIMAPQTANGAPSIPADTSTSTKAASDDDTSWRGTTDSTHDGADRKPQLYQMLGRNNKIDTQNDELRMDFVVRVAHDEVNPHVPTGGVGDANASVSKVGLRIIYDWGNGNDLTDASGVRRHLEHYDGHDPSYLNTIDTANAGESWAGNHDTYFTILKIIESGSYDYVIVSLEADMDIPNEATGSYDQGNPDSTWWKSASSTGRDFAEHVYVAVGADANASNYPLSTSTTSSILDGTTTDTNGQHWTLSTNVAANESWTAYPNSCMSDANEKYSHGCAVPISLIGYDEVPSLWSHNQANWSLLLDKPISVTNARDGINGDYPEGVAPPDSFFVQWSNPAASGDGETNPCLRQTQFKYQWFGLQNGTSWVPVSSLTATPQELDNQATSWAGQPPAGDGSITARSAFNAQTDMEGNATGNRDMTGSGSAEDASGAIDFAKAKRLQENPKAKGKPGDKDYRGLDGYFKLVTWPVVSSGCDVSIWNNGHADNTYNPADPTNPGVDASNLSAKQLLEPAEQTKIQKTIESGWTIDTAFYKFDVQRPDTPTVDSVTLENSTKSFEAISPDSTHSYALADTSTSVKFVNPASPVIHGTGTPGDTVTLYGDEATGVVSHEIDKSNPQETETKGCLIGEALVKPDGTWEITDHSQASTDPTLATRRYHAYQTENTAMHLSSNFSLIAMVRFVTTDPAPTITSVKPPVTKNGVLPKGSEVNIAGSATSQHGDSELTLYVAHATATGKEDGARRQICSVPITSTTTQSWTCSDTGPTGGEGLKWYPDQSLASTDKDPYFDFVAVLQNGLTAHSDEFSRTQRVALRAPNPNMKSVSKKGTTGTVTYAFPTGAAKADTVNLTWNTTSRTKHIASSTAKVAANGSWSAPLPAAVAGSGTVTATVQDEDGNQSAPQTLKFNVIQPASALPFTGAKSWKTLLVALLGILAFLSLTWTILDAQKNSHGKHSKSSIADLS